MQRYLIALFIRPIFVGIVSGTVLLSIGKLLELANDLIVERVSLFASLQIFLLDLPTIVVQALPIAALFSTLLTLRTLNSSGELVALRAAGISYRKICIPFLTIALLLSLSSAWIGDSIVPLTQRRISHVKSYLHTNSLNSSRLHDVFYQASPYTWLFIRSAEPIHKTLQYVSVLQANPGGDPLPVGLQQITLASSAVWDGQNWLLVDGFNHQYDPNGNAIAETHFDRRTLSDVASLQTLLQSELPLNALTRRELEEQIALQRESNLSTLELETEWHHRFAQSWASLFAVAISLPLAIGPLRSKARFATLALAVVLLFFYRFSANLGVSLGKAGVLEPGLAAWSSNLAFGAIAIYLLLRTSKA